MGKRVFTVLLVSILMCGCGGEAEDALTDSEIQDVTIRANEVARQSNSIDGFENAILEYERFNSYASENGLDGTKIYVDGFAKEEEKENGEILGFVLEQEDGNLWSVGFNNTIENVENILKIIIGNKVRVFGTYTGYTDKFNMPVLIPVNEDGSGKIDIKVDEDNFETVWSFEEYLKAEGGEESSENITNEVNEEQSQENTPIYTPTMGERNALKSAQNYLSFMAFSYNRLIEQLEYEQYSHEEAVYAADNCGADWNEQAKLSAQTYLESMSFSKDRLIQQLEYEGFTHEQAVYGVEQNGY